MASTSATFHEAAEMLRPKTMDLHRALASLMEELEAVDWYQQRVDATGDPELKAILEHNRDEEKEHAAMILEWIRRQDFTFAAYLRKYLFTEGPIVSREMLEEAATGREHENSTALRANGGSMRASIGSLKGGS
jgi:uncharacterized protein